MRKQTTLVMLFFLIFSLVTFTLNVRADGIPTIATYDENGNPQNQFNVGDKVNITAYSDTVPYYIYVFQPDGALEKTIGPITTSRYTELHEDITTDLGVWTLLALNTRAQYAVGQYQVIPETPLGVAIALSACFAGLGIKQIQRKKKVTL